jgi:hypothetical protein
MDIRHPSPSVVLLALQTIGNIAKGYDVQTQVLLHTIFHDTCLKKTLHDTCYYVLHI